MVNIRPIEAGEHPFLKEMLYVAIFMPDGDEPTPRVFFWTNRMYRVT